MLGRDALAVIDPGPDDPAHLDALRRAIRALASLGVFEQAGEPLVAGALRW